MTEPILAHNKNLSKDIIDDSLEKIRFLAEAICSLSESSKDDSNSFFTISAKGLGGLSLYLLELEEEIKQLRSSNC